MTEQYPRIGAVVLAGGSVPPALAPLCTSRALLRLGNRYILDYVMEAVTAAPSLLASVLVAPEEALPSLAPLPGRKIPAVGTLIENMRQGSAALADLRLTHVLYMTGDIPLLTVAGLEAFLSESLHSTAALTYPIIPREASERRFPGARRTYVRLKEGTFTGGNGFFTRANLLDDKQELIQQLYVSRKDPLKLAGILGWTTMLRMLTGSLTLPYLERIATRILNAPTRAIITPYPEIGFDVDKPEDLLAAERALAITVPG